MIFNFFLALTSFLLIIYIGLLLYFRQGLFRLKKPTSSIQPFVSVIVPAHNEEKNMPVLLEALSVQSYSPDKFEIILVDDRSTDRTSDLMHAFAASRPNVRILELKDIPHNTAPKKRAIRAAIEIAKGDIILTTDADSQPGERWIETMLSYYADNTVMVLGYAPYTTSKPWQSFFHRLLALEYFSMGAISAASLGRGYPSTSNGANFSYKRDAYLKAGGFGDTMQWMSGDDDLLMHRFHEKAIGTITYAFSPDAAVFNLPPEDLKHFFFQRVRFASKHLAYPPKMLLVLSAIYGLYLTLSILLFGAFFSVKLAILFLLAMGIKSTGELAFLLPAQKQLEKRNLLKYYPLAVIPHLFYVVLFPLLGQAMKPRWS